MTRSSDSDSGDSILSHITVNVRDSPDPAQATAAMSTVSRSSVGASSFNSTPPTSLDGLNEDPDARKGGNKRRVSRARSSLSTLAGDNHAASPKRKAARSKDELESKVSSRAVSGATLVEDSNSEARKRLAKELDIDMHWDMADESAADNTDGIRRRASRRSHIGLLAEEATDAFAASTTALGKRARDAIHAIKDKASAATTRTTRAQDPQSPPKRVKYEATGRMFPNLPRAAPKEKKQEEVVKLEDPPKPTRAPRIQKLYQNKGLYAGQTRSFNALVKEGTNKKKSTQTPHEVQKENALLPLPMFGTYKRLTVDDEKVFAPFKLSADILVPLKKEQNPRDWSRLNKNRFIGDAAATWDKKAYKKLDSSYCICQAQCDETCLNRHMSTECNDKNCSLGSDCGNRPFAELAFRYKNKNFSRLREGEKPEANLWGEGIETVSTHGRGFGVRAMRTFKPNQIIVEYCGEIITQLEADRRMNEDYKDKKDYYLMDFHNGLIIDATRGSICRFVNHSCDPNCRVEKWMVDGEPRMALFAGEDGIMTGEELTYDYNFEVFSKNSTQQCLCGAENCRGVLGPKSKDRPSKAKQLAGAVKGAIQGVKRKVEQMMHGEDDVPVVEQKKKRVKIGPKEVVNKIRKQIGNSTAPAVAKPDAKLAQTNKDQRARRAAERLVREKADGLGERDADVDENVELVQSTKSEVRRSMSSTIAVSDLPRQRPKTSASPAKRMSSIKKRVEAVVKSAVSATPAAPRNSSATPLLKTSDSSAIKDSKSMRQSRLSFGPIGFGFNVSPKKHAATDSEDEDTSSGPVIPNRKSSLKATTSAARPATAKSIIKGASKVAAAAKIGVQGEKGIRKTIRAVSGAAA